MILNYKQYLLIFSSLLAFYGSAIISLHLVMLNLFNKDFLETNWMAPDTTPNKELIALLGVMVIAHFASLQRPRTSDFLLTMLAIFPLIPMLAIFSYRGAAPEFVYSCIFCYLLIWVIIRLPIPNLKSRNFGIISEHWFTRYTIFLMIFVIVSSLISGNENYINFDFSEVYVFRNDANDSRITIVNYAIPNIIGFLLPISISILLKYKRYWQVIIFISFNTIIFGLTSQKSYLFTPFFAVGFYFILRYRLRTSDIILCMTFLITGIAVAWHFDIIPEILPTLTIRRMFFGPAYLNFIYFDFFTTSPKMFWSDSKISLGLINNPYGFTAPRVIMNYYYFNSMSFQFNGNANTGFLGAGFGQAGFFGMVIYSMLVAILLRVGNGIADKVGYVAACSGLTHLFIAVIFLSSDIISSFLSYGSLLMIIFAVILKKSENLV